MFERTQGLQCFFTQRGIDLDYGHGFPAPLAASEVKTTDVHAALAQDRADASNHTGNVMVASHEHVAIWHGLEIETVDLGYAPFSPLPAIAEECSSQALC